MKGEHHTLFSGVGLRLGSLKGREPSLLFKIKPKLLPHTKQKKLTQDFLKASKT
jgi:hypothetical protein